MKQMLITGKVVNIIFRLTFLSRNGFSIYRQDKAAKNNEITERNNIVQTDGSFINLILANANKGWCHKYAE